MSGLIDKIYEAQKVNSTFVTKTPLIEASGLLSGSQVFLKAENLQKTGSFKIRGAFYRISRLTDDEKKRGVIASSAGNHAQGVALSAQQAGIKCVICMPENAPIFKIQRTESYGAEVILVPGGLEECVNKAKELEKEYGYVFIHPFNDEDIVAGQGTIGLEILEQLPDVDVVLVAVGGGGLLAGVATAIKSKNPNCLVYGVESENMASMKQSMLYNEVTYLKDAKRTIADGIAVKEPCGITFEISRRLVEDIITVSEPEITLAMLKLLEEYKLLVEGAGSVSVAATMFNKVDLAGKKVACVISGGNVDINMVEKVINKGLRQTGRVATFRTLLTDKPKALLELLEIIGEEGANIVHLRHERFDAKVQFDQCWVFVTFESRGSEQRDRILNSVRDAGYHLVIETLD